MGCVPHTVFHTVLRVSWSCQVEIPLSAGIRTIRTLSSIRWLNSWVSLPFPRFKSRFRGFRSRFPRLKLGLPGFVILEDVLCFHRCPRFVPLFFTIGAAGLLESGYAASIVVHGQAIAWILRAGRRAFGKSLWRRGKFGRTGRYGVG
jgi:hypothetical protein